MKFGRYLRKSLATALIAIGGFNSVSHARFGDQFVADCKALFDKDGKLYRSKINTAMEDLCKVVGEEHFVSLEPKYSDTMGLLFWVMNEVFKDKPVFAELQKRYFEKYPKADIRFFKFKQGETFRDVSERYGMGMKTLTEYRVYDLNSEVSTGVGASVSEFDNNILVGFEENSDETFAKLIDDTALLTNFGVNYEGVVKLKEFRDEYKLGKNDNNKLFDRIYYCMDCVFSIINTEMVTLSGKDGLWLINYDRNVADFIGGKNNGDFLLKDKILDKEELEQLKTFRKNSAFNFARLSDKKLEPNGSGSCVVAQLPGVFRNFTSHELLAKIFEGYVTKFLNIKPFNLENGYF